MLRFITAVRNYVEAILAQFPKSSIALATVAAALISRLGFHITAGQLGTVVAAVTVIVSVLAHHSSVAVSARKAAAGK